MHFHRVFDGRAGLLLQAGAGPVPGQARLPEQVLQRHGTARVLCATHALGTGQPVAECFALLVAKRIVLMGFSRGGQATLYASENRFQKAWNHSGLEFAAYVPFYPDCHTVYQNDTDVANRPIRILHGTADDYNPAPPCKAFVTRLKTAGHDVELIDYPGAQHSFDSPLGSTTPTVSLNAQTVRNCRIREEPVGQLINAVSGAPFSYADPCVERNPHVGYDPDAAQAAHKYVGAFLATLFGLKKE